MWLLLPGVRYSFTPSQVERQVVKVFGIYTHAQLDKRLWDSMSRQLTKKGSEYRRRCLFRNQPAVVGDKVYTPACFPPIEKPAEEEEFFAEIPAEKLEEVNYQPYYSDNHTNIVF